MEVDALSGKSSDSVVLSSSLPVRGGVVGVPRLEIRQMEAATDGLVAHKKGEEVTYFVGKGKRGKKDKIPKIAQETDARKNPPFGTIAALSKLAIPLPTAAGNIPRAIEDLKTKKAWYEANQASVMAENIANAEAQIQHLTNATKPKYLIEGAQASVDSTNRTDTPLKSASTPVEDSDEAAGNVEADGW